MRSLHVISDTDRRGAQVFAEKLSGSLERSGDPTRLVALAPGADAGLDIEVLGRSARGLPTLRRLRRLMDTADITVAHGSSTALACALAGGGSRRSFVYRQVSDTTVWAGTRARRLRVRFALGRARIVVALSPRAAATVTRELRIAPDRLRVIPNGADAAEFAPASEEERATARTRLGLGPAPVVLVAGALTPEKGIDTAIDVIAGVAGAQLLVAGDGPARDVLQTTAERAAGGRVRFLGSVADMRTLYAAADVVLLSSRTEVMPAVLIEAGLAGVPAVATRVGSVEDIVVDGESGVLTDVDDVVALRAAIAMLLHDEDRRRAFGTRARAHCAEHFALGPVTSQWGSLLGDVARRS